MNGTHDAKCITRGCETVLRVEAQPATVLDGSEMLGNQDGTSEMRCPVCMTKYIVHHVMFIRADDQGEGGEDA